MPQPDLNLLLTLDVLLAEGSVARAARRLRLSPSAMSRTLARLRTATGDPLLVKAGRALVPSPRALELKERVGSLVEDAVAVLRPAAPPDLAHVERTFTLRTSDGFVENFGAALAARVHAEAPDVRLRFLPKPDRDGTALRDGTVDLETGVIAATTAPEIRTQPLFRDHFVGVVRKGHPLCRGEITAARYAAGLHVGISRRGLDHGPLESALQALGLQRRVTTVVGGFTQALALVRTTDLVTSVPERHTGVLREQLHTFALPIAVPEITVSLLWHPRLEADATHRWLRRCVRDVCAKDRPATSA